MNTPTLYRKELKDRILLTAMGEFRKKGIRAVKMDDIASMLSISKRTLYEIYSNKEELLMAGVQASEQAAEARLDAYAKEPDHSVMDILLEFYQMQMKNLSGVCIAFFSDLHRYERVRQFIADRHEKKEKSSQAFFELGVEQGFFRSEMDYHLISKIGSQTMAYIFENQLYREYDLQYLFRNVILLFIRGFCTIKGLEVIDRMEK